MLPLGGSYLYLYCRPIAFRSERSLSGHDGEKLDFICSTLVSWPPDFLGSSICFGRLYITIRSEWCISAPASQRTTRKERYAWCSSRFACNILIDFFCWIPTSLRSLFGRRPWHGLRRRNHPDAYSCSPCGDRSPTCGAYQSCRHHRRPRPCGTCRHRGI